MRIPSIQVVHMVRSTTILHDKDGALQHWVVRERLPSVERHIWEASIGEELSVMERYGPCFFF